MNKIKKRRIIIDADFLIFEVCEGKFTKMTMFEAENGSVGDDGYKESLKQYKKRFSQLVQDIEDEISVEMVGKCKIKGTPIIALSDPDTNFRYDLYPEYKANRKDKERSKLYYRLRKWALKKYGYVSNIEADDMVAHYVRKGYIGASFDKDLLSGVAGIWFDVYHSRRHIKETSPIEARNFNLLQTLMGDPTDNIKGIPRVGEKTAVKLLDEFGWTWVGVIKAYKSKGFSEKEAELNRRLICLNQWTPRKGVRLFKSKLT